MSLQYDLNTIPSGSRTSVPEEIETIYKGETLKKNLWSELRQIRDSNQTIWKPDEVLF